MTRPRGVLTFTSPFACEKGTIARLLTRSYATLLEDEPELWRPEVSSWQDFDRLVFDHPGTVGAHTYLSWRGSANVGFFSIDPRSRPTFGVVGHNCILPEYRGQGFGKAQIREALRCFAAMGIAEARVSTLDHPFFEPARRMYRACGFDEGERTTWNRDTRREVIAYRRAVRPN